MFQIYLLVFDGYLNVILRISMKNNYSLYSISLWGKDECFFFINKIHLLGLLTMNNNERTYFFRTKLDPHRINRNVKSITRLFFYIPFFGY
ncbi:putative polyphosphate kinase [Lupinus albus]|uniref:NAD(P)H-quinone oxidoreductase subunit 5, chloroplastic n=1 Tax=Lupinus albus TaxID=3870 RepID=A0A6A4P7N8_LUPAL|nr:putative polyphosphate kinase [Lupinus albus]